MIKNTAISEIDQMLLQLPTPKIREVKDYVGYLIDKAKKERKRMAFEKRVLKIMDESDTVKYDTVEEAMKAIRSCRE